MVEPHKPLLITPGEPAGIGPDLVVQLASQTATDTWVVVADPDLLAERAQQLGVDWQAQLVDARTLHTAPANAGAVRVWPVALNAPVEAGKLNPDNAAYVLQTLSLATDACLQGQARALVTGPVHKGVINQSGIAFTGHTEFLQARCGCDEVVMLLATEQLRVALVTTHLSLRQVADAITAPKLERILTILHQDLVQRFGLQQPHILVAGLNPHAGEGGHLGREEIEVITPLLERLKQQGMHLTGPLPADTLFTPQWLKQADAVLAMYHDQGLPVLKHLGFGQAANITLGLPLVRTSVDHGTALELAATGQAQVGSLQTALNYAQRLTR